jgi:YfiH family protein
LSSPRFRAKELEGIELLQCSPLLEEGVPHGFTLRTGAFGARENGEADRKRLRLALGFSRLAEMNQVHGSDVQVHDESSVLRCDGLMTDQVAVGVVVQSADCVPLLLWASKANAVAAVHAGWRGTLARIAARAVSRLNEVYGASGEDIQAAIGPAIRVCCYEVGDEVISAFGESGRDIGRISRPGPRGRRYLDLVEENRAQLAASGVPAERVYDSGLCTYCENDRFYSFRREGSGVGRIFGVIGPR